MAGCRAAPRKVSAHEKLNIAVIGVANQGSYNLNSVAVNDAKQLRLWSANGSLKAEVLGDC